MKHLLTLALALLLTLPATAQSAEEAIKKVCLAETQAWLDNRLVAVKIKQTSNFRAKSENGGFFISQE